MTAPALLAHADPYWILQPGFNPNDYYGRTNGYNAPDWGIGITAKQTEAQWPDGLDNLYGLPYATGLEVDLVSPYVNPDTGLPWAARPPVYQLFEPGDTITVEQATNGYLIGAYASWCPAPTLSLTRYYFARLPNPDANPMNLPASSQPPFATPLADTFAVTNPTAPLLVGAVGQPMIVGGWAEFAIANGDPHKFAYLGQYYETNAFLLDGNGEATATNAGVLSPYGEFFPLQAGTARLVTLPDMDTGAQGTCTVAIVSLNVDANHDGTMDLAYFGQDFVSAGKPFRFWRDDTDDSGDYGGDGIPGYQPWYLWDGYKLYNESPTPYYASGRRDLINYFPVYLNIAGLFQSNALSAGISFTDTNWQFVLSQADSDVLRFAYTDLTPANYMNFLRDTNESGILANARLTTVTPNGVPLDESFIAGIATNHEGVILVEAATNTTQPLVLTIYHGTNQIAQTQLPLSISGVEQMFRHKSLLLNSDQREMPDRLNDWDVPNEPDTIDRNFVFVHGYNVNPQEARGVDADMFKRMYWSGSHARFWAVTWEGSDTKGSPPFYSLLTPNYHTNVFNAFMTAPLLGNFIATLTDGTTVVAAHSLGNVVALSAISDWNASISQYFMLDAAVPMEAIDPTSSTTNMILSAWRAYSNRLYASDWYQLFPTNDARSTLAWNNRLGNLRNVDVYNFYSSGEEVLREDDSDPPFDFATVLDTQLADALIEGVPFGTYVWVWQEKAKGISTEDWLVGGSHGGWLFNTDYGSLTTTQANALPGSELQTNAFFNFGSSLSGGPNADLALLGSSGSSYAQANNSRILSDAIPALSLPIGANPVPSFDNNHNLNMNSPQFQNGWPQGRLAHGEKQNKWYHSDFHQVAYTFTYQLFDEMVTLGNLK